MAASKQSLKRAIYIDALPLVPEKKSGIGVLLAQTLSQLMELSNTTIYLVVPLGKAKYLQSYVRPNVAIKTIPLPARVLEVFLRLNIFPPMDWLLGSGVYVFPNYRNWSLWHSRSLTYVHDATFKRYPAMVQPKNLRYLQRYTARWTTRADQIITLSDHAKEEIEKLLHVPEAKIKVIYCGVDTSVFKKRNNAEVEKVKQKYHIPFSDYFLYVGSIEPRKNLLVLLEAYQKLTPQIREKYGLLLVGGDGWLNEDFKAKLAAAQQAGANIAKVTDYVVSEDLPALYSGATMLIHPAIYEGFGITPLEAMACQTPVVVSDIPPLREVAENAAYYFDPHDAQSLTSSIEEALHNHTQTDDHIRRGLVRAKELTWEKSAQELQSLIDTELAESTPTKPVLKRLKALYLISDQGLRSLLGEVAHKPYVPRKVASKHELAAVVYTDFLKEQPSYFQVRALRIYLALKHAAGRVLKGFYRAARNT